jgi:hypothetical protein
MNGGVWIERSMQMGIGGFLKITFVIALFLLLIVVSGEAISSLLG